MGDAATARRLTACLGGLLAVGCVLVSPVATAEAVVQAEAVFTVPPGAVLRAQAPVGAVTTTPTGRHPENLEFRRAPEGDLLVVADVDMETYVAGIAEMPARWPLEALKAQAVAARTYAWHQARLGTFQRRGFGYDICATTACQVYRGAEVVETPLVGQRWQEAVDATAGEVLLHDGAPILARYFSTSGGTTWPNEVIFPSEGPRPYLVGGPDPDDAVSPLHTWQATFTREQLDAILERGTELSAATPFATIETIPSSTPGLTRSVRVVGRDGTTVEVGSVAFRTFVSTVAPGLYPDEFPGPRSDGRSLPSTVPSSRFTVDAGPDDDLIVLQGRGWGHGVGMGQYGAMGKAQRGLPYDDILAAYYNGLRPVEAGDLPDRIRVGLQATPDAVAVHFDAPTPLVVGDRTLVDGAIGTWTVAPSTDGGLAVSPPAGWGDPLQLGSTATTVDAPTMVEDVVLSTTVNKSVLLTLEIRDEAGELVSQHPLGAVDAGAVEHLWHLDDVEGHTLPPGSYTVGLLGVDEEGATGGDPTAVEILGVSAADLPAPDHLVRMVARDGEADAYPWLAGVAGLLLGVAAGRVVGELRRRRRATA